ncbi:hypothetical protein ACOZ38_05785 [Sphaerisporangium viridialbum]|uniref:hypothetical protein n=1 Tax=Sphaerisporangium viridialbum TaxID=46189 RepID=UPI003C73319C
MLVELTMHTTPAHPSGKSPIDGIRILALLPDQWSKDLTQANGEITIRVETGDDTTPDEIQETVTEALTDPAISHWHLHTCHPLPTPDPSSPGEDAP